MSPAALSSQNIIDSISAFRLDGETPILNEQHWDGGQCRIFKVDFLNGESWAMRIPIHVQSNSEDAIINVLEVEKDVLEELNEREFPWAPKHHGSSLTFGNPIHFPFMVLSWIEGSPLRWTTADPPRPIRDKVLHQIAQIHMELIEYTKEDRGTATQYFARLTENKLSRVRDGKLPGITVQDCIDQENILRQVLDPELEHAPFAIDHGDLQPSNIIVDPEYNVTGIIDWGFASKVPVQLAARLPRFLQLSQPLLPPSSTLREDRDTYYASLQCKPSQVASWMSIHHSSKDIDLHHYVLESMISKGMHLSLVRLGWKLPFKE